MIQRISAKGQGLPDPHQMGDGQAMVEVMVPGPKVGLVIGKGGETIKHLQVCTNCSCVTVFLYWSGRLFLGLRNVIMPMLCSVHSYDPLLIILHISGTT